MKLYLLAIVLSFLTFNSIAQDSIVKSENHFIKTIKVFGNLYAGYYHGLNGKSTPNSAFNMPTALLGVSSEIAKNVKTTLIYDVTRTTNFSYTDTSGISGYFEGSKYTAYLKMAQIDWKIKPFLMLSVGQLLNEQYLTVQDKWWGHRYVDVTFQEKNRFGMPADFGARFTYFYKEKISFSLTAVNGEGPFRYQDDDGKHLISGNLQYNPNKKLMLKFYADIQNSAIPESISRMAFSAFGGYKIEKLMVGAEFNMLNNSNYSSDSNYDYSGLSFYSAYNFKEKVQVFGRYDAMLAHNNPLLKDYLIAGIQYSPAKSYNISINYRNNSGTEEQVIFINFGATF
ncbi:MAG: hypothetical protein JXR58_06800 [Bacteroidales bacterium]|nr:hypothetical protein [Bacteroidales bacterium]